MKFRLTQSALIATTLLIAGFFIWPDGKDTSVNLLKFQPTETVIHVDPDEESPQREKLKEEYFENMHRTAPGVSWRAIDKKTMQQNAALTGTKTVKSYANGELSAEWFEMGSSNQAGRIMAAELDTVNGLLYCGSHGGQVWKSNTSGTSWASINDTLRFESIHSIRKIPHNTGYRLLLADDGFGNGFYYSDDDGKTWSQPSGLSSIQSWGWIHKAQVTDDAARTIYLLVYEFSGSTQTCLYKSTDHGTSFSKVSCWVSSQYGTSSHFDMWSPRYGADTSFIINDTVIYYIDPSTHQAIRRSALPISPGTTISKVHITGNYRPGQNKVLYAYADLNIYRSTDNGHTWTYRGNCVIKSFRINSFDCSLTNPNRVYLGGVECMVSNDGGINWAKVNNWYDYYPTPATKLHADIPMITSQWGYNQSEITYICTDGGVYESPDQISTVQNLSLNGLNVSEYYSVYTHEKNSAIIYAGAQDQGFQRTTTATSNGPLAFDQVISGDFGHFSTQDSGQTLWMMYPGEALYFDDAVNSSPVASWSMNGANKLWLPPLMVDRTMKNRAYIAAGNMSSSSGSHIIQVTHTGGNNISPQQLSYDFESTSGGYITALASSPINPNYWYVMTNNGKFFYSSNAGQSWTYNGSFAGPDGHYFYGASIHASEKTLGKVWVAGSGYSVNAVWESSNHGQSFTALSNNIPTTLFYDIISSPDDNFLYGATEVGPYIYSFSQSKWFYIGSGMPNTICWSVEYVDALKTVRYATHGRGIWDFRIQPAAAVAEHNRENTFGIYPNPGTANQMKLDLRAWKDKTFELQIFSISGKLLYSKSYTANQSPNVMNLPAVCNKPGTYLVRLQSGTNAETGKFVVH